MPYIKEEDRKSLDHDNQGVYDRIGVSPWNAGSLNYRLTTELTNFMALYDVSYELLNTIMGVLESVKQEFYRRVVAPYEDQKCKDHGDVYGTGCK